MPADAMILGSGEMQYHGSRRSVHRYAILWEQVTPSSIAMASKHNHTGRVLHIVGIYVQHSLENTTGIGIVQCIRIGILEPLQALHRVLEWVLFYVLIQLLMNPSDIGKVIC